MMLVVAIEAFVISEFIDLFLDGQFPVLAMLDVPKCLRERSARVEVGDGTDGISDCAECLHEIDWSSV